MGFISNAIGAKNDFVATPASNTVQGHMANTVNANYAPAMQQAQQQGLASNALAGSINNQQAGLAGQLQQQASGAGPSLAQMQLQQATDSNVNQAAGAIASQKGINPGLAARLIAQNQAGVQQQAAGQSAMTRLAQQQSAQQQLANVYGQQQQGALSQAGLANQLYGTTAGANNAQNQATIQNSLGAQQISAQGQLANQQANMQAQGINAGIAQQNTSTNAGILSGVIGAAAGAGAAALYGGGEVKGYADGGYIPQIGPSADFSAMTAGLQNLGGATVNHFKTNPMLSAQVPQTATPFQSMIPAGGFDYSSLAAAQGAVVPGKAQVRGNSPKNDTVPAKLSPGEIVLPRSVTQDDDAPEKAKAFVKAIRAKKRAA